MQLDLPGLCSSPARTMQTAPVQLPITQHLEAGDQASGVGSTKGLTMELKVTGLANETDFKNPGDVIFLIVFNDGALRVPTTKEGADGIIKAMLSQPASNGKRETAESHDAEQYTPPADPDDDSSPDDEDGIPAA